jgi:hypothetical protein
MYGLGKCNSSRILGYQLYFWQLVDLNHCTLKRCSNNGWPTKRNTPVPTNVSIYSTKLMRSNLYHRRINHQRMVQQMYLSDLVNSYWHLQLLRYLKMFNNGRDPLNAPIKFCITQLVTMVTLTGWFNYCITMFTNGQSSKHWPCN